MSDVIIPRGSAERCAWFTNWKVEFPGLAPGLGFSPAELTAILNDADWAIYVCKMADDADDAHSAWVAWRDVLLDSPNGQAAGTPPATTAPAVPGGAQPLAGVLERFTAVIARVKAAPGYADSMGDSLRINPPPAPPFDPALAKPELKPKAEPLSTVRVKWVRGDFDALRLRTRRDGDADWLELGVKVKPPYVDTRPPATPGKPEIRSYQGIYEMDGAPVGLWSDVANVTTQP